jgi:N6-L-threonylcarbamoyladenine synthase
MICLGIESTAHTLGIGIVDDKFNVLANEKETFTTNEGGIRPIKAAEHHVLFFEQVLSRALEKAKLNLRDINLVAFSQGPGLGQCLRIGAVAARTLALRLKVPIIGVNHCIAHVESGKITSKFKDPVTLYVSGANTQILALASGRYRVFGETLDTGVGNFLDSFGRVLGIGFPAGPKIEELVKTQAERRSAGHSETKSFAREGKYIELPYTIKGMDFTFSGILTKLEQLYKTKKYSKEDLCFSAQETVFAMLTEATERAVAHINKKEVVLTGGVASNQRLVEMLSIMCKERGVKFAAVPRPLAVDNGGMIAMLGILEHKAGVKQGLRDSKVSPYQRTDQIDVTW